MTQWISVEEDSPDIGQQVIVARENGDVTMASYEALREEGTTYYMWVEGDWLLKDVTHWQLLPDHPDILEGPFSEMDDYGFLDPDEFYD